MKLRFVPYALALSALHAQSPNPAMWSNFRYRMIGPERGGRVTAVTGVPSQPNTFYMGSTGGGVWKTLDAGHTWTNISDGQIPLGSMGAIEVSLSNPDIIYAGTGSSKIRSNVSIGHGIYKSTDAGKNWTFSGLRDVGQIATVRVHATNPDLVYVAALGNPFIDNPDRGIFRSTDGGKTWKKILHISDSAGAADLELQPGSPNVLFACMWHGQRKPWTIISGAREGGIYKSTDGGDHWTKLAGGLPNELFGRSNVAISAAAPNRIYALIEAKPGSGLYRSDDGGTTWSVVNGSGNLITRPFYYTTLGVDPVNPDVLFIGDEGWFRSSDGGKNFRPSPAPHGDHHDIWINPRNSQYMIQSNDGGANVSLDGGRTWSVQSNQPTAEIYQLAVDNQYPYRVYGAQQDNTTVIVPSLPLGNGQDFRVGPGCETGPIIPSPLNADLVYGSCKGQFSVLDLATTNEERYWVGAESLYGNGGSDLIYRFQRVSPMEVSPHDGKVVYYGSQHVHRTRDGGVNWEKISPDLTARPEGTQGPSGEPITRDATGEEIYSTLYSIRESPLQKGVIWAGSNDGLIHVSRDDGKTWANVTPTGLPSGARVQNLEPGTHNAATAYAAIYRFLLGDFHPYIYRTSDYGKTWTLLTDGKNGIAADEPTRVVREDPVRAGLLYAGTEFGMYISFDNGAHWQSFQLNLPNTPVTDIKLAHGDLILSTQGRSFWVLDNLSPLRQLPTTSGNKLYTPRDAVRTPGRGGFGRGSSIQYPLSGAQIDYYLSAAPAGDLVMEILDARGAAIRKFTSSTGTEAPPADAADAPPSEEGEGGPRIRSGPTRLDKFAGPHRFTWDLRYPGPWINANRPEGPNGPTAVPSKYSVRLTAGAWSETQPLTIVEDPRIAKSGVTQSDLQEQFDHNVKVRDLVSDVNRTVMRVRTSMQSLAGSPANAETLAKLKDLAADLITPPIRYSKPGLQTHITYLYSLTTATDQKIGRDAIDRYNILKKELDARIAELTKILGQ
ncbi:MAG TPA: hypothetical protein VKE70_12695 [Candidatus Solibacter sp.]|nr:hypothetical protein [Candidatus Solibacter sp.]